MSANKHAWEQRTFGFNEHPKSRVMFFTAEAMEKRRIAQGLLDVYPSRESDPYRVALLHPDMMLARVMLTDEGYPRSAK